MGTSIDISNVARGYAGLVVVVASPPRSMIYLAPCKLAKFPVPGMISRLPRPSREHWLTIKAFMSLLNL